MVFAVGYLFFEKYIGFVLDIAALCVAIVICSIASISLFDGRDFLLISLSVIGLILTWNIKRKVALIAEAAEEAEEK